jgi:hypothetical protein
MDIDHRLNNRLRAANRVPTGALSTNALKDRLDSVGAKVTAVDSVVEAPVRPHRRSHASRRTVVVGSVLGVLAVGGVAAASNILSTYTGQSAGPLAGALGSGQELRVGVPGYCQAALNATSSIPFPAADDPSWKDWLLISEPGSNISFTLNQFCNTSLLWNTGADGGTGHTGITTGLLQLRTTESAFCAYTDQWLTATANGDTTTASAAASQIESAFRWPLSSTIDPSPSAGQTTPSNILPPPGSTPLGWFLPTQAAVQSGNVAAVQPLFETDSTSYAAGDCVGFPPPADSDNGTVFQSPDGDSATAGSSAS